MSRFHLYKAQQSFSMMLSCAARLDQTTGTELQSLNTMITFPLSRYSRHSSSTSLRASIIYSTHGRFYTGTTRYSGTRVNLCFRAVDPLCVGGRCLSSHIFRLSTVEPPIERHDSRGLPYQCSKKVFAREPALTTYPQSEPQTFLRACPERARNSIECQQRREILSKLVFRGLSLTCPSQIRRERSIRCPRESGATRPALACRALLTPQGAEGLGGLQYRSPPSCTRRNSYHAWVKTESFRD